MALRGWVEGRSYGCQVHSSGDETSELSAPMKTGYDFLIWLAVYYLVIDTRHSLVSTLNERFNACLVMEQVSNSLNFVQAREGLFL